MNTVQPGGVQSALGKRAATRRIALGGFSAFLSLAWAARSALEVAEARKRKKRRRKKRRERGEDRCNQTRCNGACVDLETDPAHCGACGAACPEGTSCVGGLCAAVFGGPGPALGQYDSPSGIAFAGDGLGFVADTDNQRLVRIVAGAANLAITVPEFRAPVGVAVNPDSGETYVVDKDIPLVFRLNANGQALGTFGGSAEADGGFVIPAGIAVNRDNGQVFVADFRRDHIAHFTAVGSFLRKIGGTGSGDGEFNAPFGMTCDSEGNLYVADSGNHRVQVLNSNGNFVRAFGRQGDGNGEFESPVGVAIAADGNLLVVDQGNNRVQELTPDGRFVRSFGRAGDGIGEFEQPSGIATDGELIGVVDAGNNRLQVFFPPSAAAERASP